MVAVGDFCYGFRIPVSSDKKGAFFFINTSQKVVDVILKFFFVIFFIRFVSSGNAFSQFVQQNVNLSATALLGFLFLVYIKSQISGNFSKEGAKFGRLTGRNGITVASIFISCCFDCFFIPVKEELNYLFVAHAG